MNRNAKIVSLIAVGLALIAVALIVLMNLPARDDGSIDAWLAKTSIAPSGAGAIAAGKMADDFRLQDLKGNAISLSSLRGKVVFLNVWATWCAPCREEMPSIESLYKEFGTDKDFVVLAVSQDTDWLKAVAPYVEKNGCDFTVLLDPRNEVGEAYRVSGVPETFIIGRDGRIVAHHVGPYDWSTSEMREALQELIKSKEG
jgi:cytochrome c biogenesis protein CcmG/thiol:disulfide interchange protein DsbE